MLTKYPLPKLHDNQVYMQVGKHSLLDMVDWLSEHVSPRMESDSYLMGVAYSLDWWVESWMFGWIIEIRDSEKFVEFKLRFS